MEDGPFARLFRASQVTAIWEGSGNVQCLDLLRAMEKTPTGRQRTSDRWMAALQTDSRDLADLKFRALDMVDRMALAT